MSSATANSVALANVRYLFEANDRERDPCVGSNGLRDWETDKYTFCTFKGDALTAGVATEEQAVNVTEVTVPRAVYAELTQELREKEEAIRTLNHKIAYLESSMRLKDLRISSLTEQIPQNAVGDTDQTKPRASCESTYSKLRARSHNLCEAKTN